MSFNKNQLIMIIQGMEKCSANFLHLNPLHIVAEIILEDSFILYISQLGFSL